MLTLNDKQRELVGRIDCSQCVEHKMCDQVKRECPKINLNTLQVDDVAILRPPAVYYIIDENHFEGCAEAKMTDGIVSYTGMTLDEYRQHSGNPNLVAIPETEFFERCKNFKNSLVTGFSETTKEDFDLFLYSDILRCRFANKVLSFFSRNKHASLGRYLMFFTYQGRYYKACRDKNLSDEELDRQIWTFLYPGRRSFMYQGWWCRYNTHDRLFHLYTPAEQEQPSGSRR